MTATQTSPGTTVDAFEHQFQTALKAIRQAGVKVRQNLPGGSIGSIEEGALGLTRETEPTTPYLFTYGGQGNRYTWRNGLPYYAAEIKPSSRYGAERLERDRSKVKAFYLYHGGPDVEAATVAARVLREHGLTVEWDGTSHGSVIVLTPFFVKGRDRF
jgi:hypothetical protein